MYSKDSKVGGFGMQNGVCFGLTTAFGAVELLPLLRPEPCLLDFFPFFPIVVQFSIEELVS